MGIPAQKMKMMKKKMESTSKGTDVEVRSQEEGFLGSWFTAKILKLPTKKKQEIYLVEYHNLLDDNDESKLLREEVHYHNIRPLQPNEPPQMFRVNDEVDAFHNDGWWKGVIVDVLEDSRYNVFFECTKTSLGFSHSDLRLHMEWIEGKWFHTSQKKNQESMAVEQVEGNSNPTNLTGSSPCSTDIASQPTPVAVMNNLLENRVSSSRNMNGGMDYESSRSVKKPRLEEAITSISAEACSSRGTKSIGMPIDEGTHTVLSFSMPRSNRRRSKFIRPLNQVFSELHSRPSLLRSETGNHKHVPKGQKKEDLESYSVGRDLSLECGSHLHPKETEKFVTGLATIQENTLLEVLAANSETGNIVTSGRGWLKGSGVENQDITGKTMNNIHMECTRAWSNYVEDCQTPFMFPGKDASSILEEDGGSEDESLDNALEGVEKFYTELLGPSLKELDAPYSSLENSSPPMTGDEACKNDLGIVEIERTHLSRRTIKEHQTLRACCNLPNPQTLDEKEVFADNQIEPVEATTDKEIMISLCNFGVVFFLCMSLLLSCILRNT